MKRNWDIVVAIVIALVLMVCLIFLFGCSSLQEPRFMDSYRPFDFESEIGGFKGIDFGDTTSGLKE